MFPHERTQRHLAMDFQLQRIEEMADMKDNSPFCVLRKESRGDLHTCRTFSEHVARGGTHANQSSQIPVAGECSAFC